MWVRTLIGLVTLVAQIEVTASGVFAIPPAAVQELVVRPQPKCLAVENAPAPAPKIVSVYPAEGQVVRPGFLVVRITFDRPMACSGFLTKLVKTANPCPPEQQTFIWTFDHKTIRTLCLTRPRQNYGVAIGGGCALPFVSLDGQWAQPLAVRFSTSAGAAVTSVQGALAEDTETQSAVPGGAPMLGLDGTWQGQIADWRGARPLFLNLSTKTNGALSATLDSPFRKIFGETIEGFRLAGTKVEFRDFAASASYAGALSADRSTIRGLWTRDGEATPVDFSCVPGRGKPGGVGGFEAVTASRDR